MARFNDAWMELLLSKSDIASLVSEYVLLRTKGRKLWGLCPFHNEKTPSFSVSPDKQMYYCFGCGAGGGIIQFVMDVERLPYLEAIQFLAQRAGMELPSEVDDESIQQERIKKERLYGACKAAARFYNQTLLGEKGAEARKYLANRGLDVQIVQRFGLGYAPDSWDAAMLHLKKEGFEEADLLEAGILIRNERTGNVYDAYRNRVIFPIIGANARVMGFGARTMGDDIPKYLNTGDTPIYSKRRNLYALQMLKDSKAPDAIMVEGYMDVISLHAGNVKNAVASLGTSLTQQQARLLKRYVSSVYIAYDGDAAGQGATLRGLDILAAEGLSVRVIVFPGGMDPDDYIRKNGKEAFDALKEKALALNEFKLLRMADVYDLKKAEGRQEYAMAGCRFIAGLQPVEQELYYTVLARQTGLSLETLRAQGTFAAGAAQTSATPSPHVPLQEPPRPVERQARARQESAGERERVELLLLMALLRSADTAQAVCESEMNWEQVFSKQALYDYAMNINAARAAGKEPDPVLLMSALSPEQAQVIAGMMGGEEIIGDTFKFANDCLKRLQTLDLDVEILALREKAAAQETSLADKLAFTQRITALDKKRRALK